MKNKVVVINVKGGVVQSISSNDESIGYVLIDWDNIEGGDKFPTEDEVYDMDSIFTDLGKYLEEILEDSPLYHSKKIIKDTPESLRDFFEENDFRVYPYKDYNEEDCAEITIHTKGGVEMNITLEPFNKESFIDYVNEFDINEEIDTLRKLDSKYVQNFSIRESLNDFEDFNSKLVNLANRLR